MIASFLNKAVIVSMIASAITVQIVILINIKLLCKKLMEFQNDVIETCTSEVAKYVHKSIYRD